MSRLDDLVKKVLKNQTKQYDTLIIGSGAAGLNCALHLIEEKVESTQIAIITENLGGGTSFNTGSDKQTYYKMSIIGDQSDSPVNMAQDMVVGGAMHGDIALIEATNSLREFFHLVHLGVSFPYDKYGGYVGYKTDYDPRQRATSIGPLTSQKMCECLLHAVKEANIKIWDKHYSFKIITDKNQGNKKAIGLITINLKNLSQKNKNLENLIGSVKIFLANNIIIATGGPAALYKYSVYPQSQWGSLGLAIDAGCKLQNLTESQFGLASTQFRWNLSGSYQQVIPRYVSITEEDKEIEFLTKYFPSFEQLSKAIFLKGYQWPFNSERIQDFGSSLIDLAVYHETEVLKRDVCLDFTKNPSGYNEDDLDPEAKQYLKNSKALAKNPIKRLEKLNPDAIALYKEHGIDLWKEHLNIATCNQHLNGGIQGDMWWETNIKHLFAIGEANGSHGVHRPGGSALNAGQVGGLRAAQKIAYYCKDKDLPEINQSKGTIDHIINSVIDEFRKILLDKDASTAPSQILTQIRKRMANYGSIIRPLEGLYEEINEIKKQLREFSSIIEIDNNRKILSYLRVKDALKTQECILNSILNYHQSRGRSRGSYLIIRKDLDTSLNERYIAPPCDLEQFKYIIGDIDLKNRIQTVEKSQGKMNFNWEAVRPIPTEFGWFETVWKKFKNRKLLE